jgi:Zn finger protein HypA/HybF involved in hydrogenase expression
MRYEKEKLKSIVEGSNSYSEVTRKLGLKPYYGNRKTTKKYIELFKIDTSHFGNYSCGGNKEKKDLSDILTSGSTYDNRHLKKRIISDGLLEYKCVKCDNEGVWNGEILTLQLDHINGINNDNRIENLRFLCPNCHSQTKTFGGKNTKLKANKKIEYCECGNEKTNGSKTCLKCNQLNQRKVERPPYEQLMKEIEELGYRGTGRKYGVSDNSIRKWKKNYEK